MSSRQTILDQVRKHQPAEVPRPELVGDWIAFADPVSQFATVLSGVGGRCVEAADWPTAARIVADLPEVLAAQKWSSLVPEIPGGNVAVHHLAGPHDAADLDVAVMPGVWAIAENGAVWLTDAGWTHRVLPFIVQHLVLVVPRANVLTTLHEAYERIELGDQPSFGLFLSGPSKTADIEQSLVIGAHGPCSHTVVLVG